MIFTKFVPLWFLLQAVDVNQHLYMVTYSQLFFNVHSFVYLIFIVDNEDFSRNLIWQHQQQQQHQKISNQQQQQNIKQLTSEDVSKYTQEKTFLIKLKSLFNNVSSLEPAAWSNGRLRHRCFPAKLLRTRFFIEHFQTSASGRAQNFTKRAPSNNS